MLFAPESVAVLELTPFKVIVNAGVALEADNITSSTSTVKLSATSSTATLTGVTVEAFDSGVLARLGGQRSSDPQLTADSQVTLGVATNLVMGANGVIMGPDAEVADGEAGGDVIIKGGNGANIGAGGDVTIMAGSSHCPVGRSRSEYTYAHDGDAAHEHPDVSFTQTCTGDCCYTGSSGTVKAGTVKIQSEDTYISVEEIYDVDATPRREKGLISIVTDGNTMMEFDGDNNRVEVLEVLLTNGFQMAGSDHRIKEEIHTADPKLALENFRKLRLVEFKHIPEYVESRHVYDGHAKGFIAQEVEKILPHAVHTMPRKFEGNSNTKEIEDMKHVQYDYMYLEMFGAMKEMLAEVDTLKQEVSSLKQQLATKDNADGQ